MVTKSRTSKQEEKKRKVKVGKLQLNEETVKDLTGSDAKRIRGGAAAGDEVNTKPKGCHP